MSRIEKNLVSSAKRIYELETRIKEDTKTLNRLKMEHEKLQAKKIAEFTKNQNIDVDADLFEMLSLFKKINSEGITVSELSELIGTKHEISKEDVINETHK